MIIRKKELKDCEPWVDVNIRSWNDNLKGVVSDKLLEYMRNKRESMIEKAKIDFEENDWKYVLEENSKVIGIMKLKEAEKEEFKGYGEIQILYLYKEEKGKGYGKALVKKGFEVLKKKGYKKVIIGCLEKNPSNGFYKHIGGKFVKQEQWNILNEQYMENIYEYEI